MAQVMVSIDGRSYRMACDDGQEPYIKELASDLDAQVRDLRERFGPIGDMRLLLMASLIVADDLKIAQRQVRELEAENEHLKTVRGSLLEQSYCDQDHNARYLNSGADRLLEMSKRMELLAKLNDGTKEEPR